MARPEAKHESRLVCAARAPCIRNATPTSLIAATIVALALLWRASLRAAAVTRGGVNVAAKAAFLILTSSGCIEIGFFLPRAPVISALIGNAFWAGLLATAGAFVGIGLSDSLLNRIEMRLPGDDLTTSLEHT